MKEYIIENEYQKITILNAGATIHKWEAFSDKRNILISNANTQDYLNPDCSYMGATVGRVANRVGKAKFDLNGKTYFLDQNFGKHCGHGGYDGFFRQKFEVIRHEKELIELKYFSKHMESKFPGNVELYVNYALNANQMTITYTATTDEDTILNITNHSYFNLSKENTILNHFFTAGSTKSIETDADLIPTGKIFDNTNNVLNLTKVKSLKEIVFDPDVLRKANGIDHFFLFNKSKEMTLSYKNLSLHIETTYPGLQTYTFQKPTPQVLEGRVYEKYIGIAFEPQIEPDAINHPDFNSTLLKNGETYFENIIYTLNEDN